MKQLFRIADLNNGRGLWYDRSGKFTGRILTDFGHCPSAALPMGHDPVAAVGWLSACDTISALDDWFTPENREAFKVQGYTLCSVQAESYMHHNGHWWFMPDRAIVTEMPNSLDGVIIDDGKGYNPYN